MKRTIYLSAILIMTMCAAVSLISAQGTMNSNSMKPNPDSKFMMMLSTGGMNEIGLSRTALSKSTNDDVKQFAQKMIDEHTAAGDELKSLAASKSVTLPMEMDAKHMALNTKLNGMSGTSFDMEYMNAMVKDHLQTISLLQKEANAGKDAEGRALALKLMPVVQGHLDMARMIMSKMSGK